MFELRSVLSGAFRKTFLFFQKLKDSHSVFSSKPETSVLSQQPATWQRSILVFCFQKPKTETHFACTFLQTPKLDSHFVLFLEIRFCNFPFLQIPILPRINCKPKFTQIPIFANSHFIENRLYGEKRVYKDPRDIIILSD